MAEQLFKMRTEPLCKQDFACWQRECAKDALCSAEQGTTR
jgi:hypothetical protein